MEQKPLLLGPPVSGATRRLASQTWGSIFWSHLTPSDPWQPCFLNSWEIQLSQSQVHSVLSWTKGICLSSRKAVADRWYMNQGGQADPLAI